MFSGLLGDRISYKLILITDLIIMIVSSTSFLYIPRFETFTLTPTLYMQPHPELAKTFQVLSVDWPHQSCKVTSLNSTLCQQDIDSSPEFFDNLAEFADCDWDGLLLDYSLENVTLLPTKNGTLCHATSNISDLNSSSILACPLRDHVTIQTCNNYKGSHYVTFGLYIVARLIFDIFMNSAFCLLDGAALKQAKQCNSDYSLIAFFLQIGATFGTLASGFLVDDSDVGKMMRKD